MVGWGRGEVYAKHLYGAQINAAILHGVKSWSGLVLTFKQAQAAACGLPGFRCQAKPNYGFALGRVAISGLAEE